MKQWHWPVQRLPFTDWEPGRSFVADQEECGLMSLLERVKARRGARPAAWPVTSQLCETHPGPSTLFLKGIVPAQHSGQNALLAARLGESAWIQPKDEWWETEAPAQTTAGKKWLGPLHASANAGHAPNLPSLLWPPKGVEETCPGSTLDCGASMTKWLPPQLNAWSGLRKSSLSLTPWQSQEAGNRQRWSTKWTPS